MDTWSEVLVPHVVGNRLLYKLLQTLQQQSAVWFLIIALPYEFQSVLAECKLLAI